MCVCVSYYRQQQERKQLWSLFFNQLKQVNISRHPINVSSPILIIAQHKAVEKVWKTPFCLGGPANCNVNTPENQLRYRGGKKKLITPNPRKRLNITLENHQLTIIITY